MSALVWRASLADLLFEEFAAATLLFYDAVVAPACAVLSGTKEAASGPETALDLEEYVGEVGGRASRLALALGLAGLWESHFREYMWKSAAILGSRNVTPRKVEQGRISDLEAIFLELRGFPLEAVPAYAKLRALVEVANASRHGNGRSSQRAFDLYPEYFSSGRPHAGVYSYVLHGATAGNDVRHLDVTGIHLADFATSIVTFWNFLRECARLGDQPPDPEPPSVAR